VASQWVEADKNLVAGESIARHLLYTRRFMKDELGLEPEEVPIDWSPDTFGHARTIPTLVSRGGVTRYYACRGGRDDKPPVFWWRGPDGSRVLVNLETTWYLKAAGPENASALLAFAAKTGLRDWMNVYGVGDHGGGPTRRDIRRILETAGKASTARLDLGPLLGVPAAAEEVDFLERPVTKGTARVGSGGVTVDVPAYGVSTVRVAFR